MLQDIAPHHFDNHYDPSRPIEGSSRILYFQKEALFLLPDFSFPSATDMTPSDPEYLFSLDGISYFLSKGIPHLPSDGFFLPAKKIRSCPDLLQVRIFIAWTALQILRWIRENRYCGSCGSLLVPSPKERARICPSCGRTIYPRLNPAIIAAVTWENKLLLTRYANRPISHYALIAGFTEIGETLEETVAREVMEETGLKVKNIRYYKSQPWASDSDILAGFFCEVEGSTDIVMDREELKEAFWAERKEIILQPDNFSLTNEMMKVFKESLIQRTTD